MIQGMGAALSGLRAYINQTKTTANNIANLNTPGFKGSRPVQAAAAGNQGVNTIAVQTGHTQGGVVFTGQAFDMAISGDGFFRVKTPGGATGYTRSGSFLVNKDGKLADAAGNVLDPQVNVPGGAKSVTVERDGSVTALINGERQTIGQVELYKFNSPEGLQRGGGSLYYETDASGQPVGGAPGSGGLGEIYPASLELSNVDLGEQMVNLIQSRHGVSAQVKTIQASDEMLGALLDIKT